MSASRPSDNPMQRLVAVQLRSHAGYGVGATLSAYVDSGMQFGICTGDENSPKEVRA